MQCYEFNSKTKVTIKGQSHSFNISTYRLALFTGGSIITHELGSGQLSFRRHKQDSPAVTNGSDTQCTSLFIEPVSWMLPSLEGTIEGKVTYLLIKCPT